MDFDGQGLAIATRTEWVSAHSDPTLFPYFGGKNGAVRMVYAIGTEQIDAPSELPPPSLKSRVVILMYADRDGWACHLCLKSIDRGVVRGKHIASPDHLIPRSHGGNDYPSNLLTAHLSCNKSRRNAPLAHVQLSESLTDRSLSPHHATHDRKGREGKGRDIGEEVGSCCIVSTGSASRFARGRLVPGNACTEISGGRG